MIFLLFLAISLQADISIVPAPQAPSSASPASQPDSSQVEDPELRALIKQKEAMRQAVQVIQGKTESGASKTSTPQLQSADPEKQKFFADLERVFHDLTFYGVELGWYFLMRLLKAVAEAKQIRALRWAASFWVYFPSAGVILYLFLSPPSQKIIFSALGLVLPS